MKQLVVCAALIAAACNKGQEPLDCASVIPGAIDRMMASAKGELPPEALTRAQQVAPKLKAAIVRVCRDDKWSEEVIDCHRIASTQADINICQRKLDATQRAHTDKATENVIESFNAPGAAAGSAATTGSATSGSATSGSAGR